MQAFCRETESLGTKALNACPVLRKHNLSAGHTGENPTLPQSLAATTTLPPASAIPIPSSRNSTTADSCASVEIDIRRSWTSHWERPAGTCASGWSFLPPVSARYPVMPCMGGPAAPASHRTAPWGPDRSAAANGSPERPRFANRTESDRPKQLLNFRAYPEPVQPDWAQRPSA